MRLLDWFHHLTSRSRSPSVTKRGEPSPDQSGQRPTLGFLAGSDEDLVRDMTDQELIAWENRGVPTIDRPTDRVEGVADEKQDVTTSVNFPLHWTSLVLAWGYLFDIAIAGELLAPRPDDRVLDVAAGTGWASELLTRLGVRTVSADMSWEMLRRGRQRLAADDRLVFRDQSASVAARTQALPFVSDSFDGILCLNALHHLPSYREGLREIHRVLKPGGRAVFSEPGTAHATEALSSFRMREEGIVEKAVSLPYIRRLAFEVGFTDMTVVPLRAASTYAFSYAAAPPDDRRLHQMWEDTLRHSPREHARFALHKGHERAADTLLPPQQLLGRLRATILLRAVCERVRQGQPFTDDLRVANAGTVTWKARGRRFGGQVTCGLKVCDLRGHVIREDLGRTALARDVAPGEAIDIDMRIIADLAPGTYELRYDMVVEGVTWFESHASPCPRRRLEVLAQ
jgi:SAM-dependent methyltransferase